VLRPLTSSMRPVLRRIWSEAKINAPFTPASKQHAHNVAVTKGRSLNVQNFPVLNWIVTLDEFSHLFTLMHFMLKGADLTTSTHCVCVKVTLGSLRTQVNCIRKIVLDGFDVQARILARSLSEYIDLVILLLLYPPLADEFHAACEPEEANKFWHKHISKGKLKARLVDLCDAENEALFDYILDMQAYQKEEEEMMYSALHPSFLTSAMMTGMGMSHGMGGTSMYGIVDSASVRTLSFIFYRLTQFVIICNNQLASLFEPQNRGDCDLIEPAHHQLKFVRLLAPYVCLNRKSLPLNAAPDYS
jgi:hypothetical protein